MNARVAALSTVSGIISIAAILLVILNPTPPLVTLFIGIVGGALAYLAFSLERVERREPSGVVVAAIVLALVAVGGLFFWWAYYG